MPGHPSTWRYGRCVGCGRPKVNELNTPIRVLLDSLHTKHITEATLEETKQIVAFVLKLDGRELSEDLAAAISGVSE